jgi:hypothetical protein
MVIKYTNIYHSNALQNIPKFGIFGLKINHLATLICTYTRATKMDEISSEHSRQIFIAQLWTKLSDVRRHKRVLKNRNVKKSVFHPDYGLPKN